MGTESHSLPGTAEIPSELGQNKKVRKVSSWIPIDFQLYLICIHNNDVDCKTENSQ
jgi:hypothetical protein